jgi:hypothetical protein
VVAAVTVGCADAPAAHAIRSAAREQPEVTMDAAVRPADGGLLVEYRIRNDDTLALGLFNRLPVVGPTGAVTYAGAAYIDFDAARASVHVRHVVLPVPDGLDIAARPVPYLTRVDPGQTHTETVWLAVPIAVCNPLRAALLSARGGGRMVVASRPGRAARLTVSVGVVALRPEWRLLAAAEAEPRVLRLWPPGPGVDAQVVHERTLRLPRSVQVLDYAPVSARSEPSNAAPRC